MTADAAIRIVRKSLQRVHFTHKIKSICREQSTDLHTQVCGVQMIKQNLSLAYFSIGSSLRVQIRNGTHSFSGYRVLYFGLP
jgi:hypothetical protein